MQQQNGNSSAVDNDQIMNSNELTGNDFSEILNAYGLNYDRHDYFLQVGAPADIQGWLLHISVIISQVIDMYHAVIPILIEENIPFKIPMDKEVTRSILNGNLGAELIGKTLSIYPENDAIALRLARKLILVTQKFEGPAIPTDQFLGGTLYTRYGVFRPIILINNDGKKTKCFRNLDGELIEDVYHIPFKITKGIRWPFSPIKDQTEPKPLKGLKGKYRITGTLKADVRGNVYQALYLKSLFNVKKCVIKQGTRKMLSEDSGRDMADRLAWQYKLHKQLEETVALPKAIELFEENGDAYFTMEYIDGISFLEWLKKVTYNVRPWKALRPREQKELLKYLLKILKLIEALHKAGYVHRDIVPGNFLINEAGEIILIDLELAYSIAGEFPNPAYELGTPGFMSPEQQKTCKPTFKEDVYAMGAMMLLVFTGLSPIKFCAMNQEKLFSDLVFFTNDERISKLITDCLNTEPNTRPEIKNIQTTLENHQDQLSNNYQQESTIILDKKLLIDTIDFSISGLVKPPMVLHRSLWYSKSNNKSHSSSTSNNNHQQKEYTIYAGLKEGLGGILYLLARAKTSGISVDVCIDNYYSAWDYIQENYFSHIQEIAPGLYNGAAGLALSVNEAIKGKLFENCSSNTDLILDCLNFSLSDLNVANGVSGQGIAALQCSDFINQTDLGNILNPINRLLLEKQKKDGSWLLSTLGEGEKGSSMSFGYGIPGIAWYLFEYMRHFQETSCI